jgi:hypothetical protein
MKTRTLRTETGQVTAPLRGGEAVTNECGTVVEVSLAGKGKSK